MFNLSKMDWVIVRRESGGKARPIKAERIGKIKESGETTSTPYFLKQ